MSDDITTVENLKAAYIKYTDAGPILPNAVAVLEELQHNEANPIVLPLQPAARQ